jgi:hypothetical protein
VKTNFPLRRILLLASGLAVAVTAITWLATGAHRGWTRTEITTMQHDEITGLDYPVNRPGFVAGVDFLGAGAGLALALGAAALLVRRRSSATAA